ncbi:g7654 [Coccomyxa elongata]
MTGSPFQRIQNGFERHRNFTGHEPDAVVYSSFLWDMQRWGHYEPEKVATKEISPDTLAEWSDHLRSVLRFIEEKSPTAVARVYKTTVPPLTKDCASADGRFQAAEMGRKGHVLALNAVARGVADSKGWATIDMSPIIGSFSEREYLRDMHHPAKQISLTALNLLLNIVFSKVDGANSTSQVLRVGSS